MGRWHDFEPLQEAECGTPAGASRHRDLGEDICSSCKRGLARYRRRLRAADDGGGVGMSIDCDDLGLPNQYELPTIRCAPDPTWAADAACLGKPGDWWFPDHEVKRGRPVQGVRAGAASGDAMRAIEICGSCPVQAQCLRHAIQENEDHGIWGGRTQEQRRRIRRQTRGAA